MANLKGKSKPPQSYVRIVMYHKKQNKKIERLGGGRIRGLVVEEAPAEIEYVSHF